MSVHEPANRAAQTLYQAMIGASGPEETGWTGSLDSLDLPPAPREGRSVLVLGAGLGGLAAAYELSKRGYECTVLEAQNRTGGRNRTARNGDKLYEIDSTGTPVLTHTCSFDDQLYFNLGPGRIPYHHRRVLTYCHDFQVALEPYIMETTASLVRLSKNTFPPVRWRNRQVANDVRGYLAALLAKTLPENGEFTKNLRDLLRVFGALADGEYHGSTRSGYQLDIHDFPRPAPPLDFAKLVESKFWKANFYQPVDYLWQATLFQPVGGMDKIVKAFTEKITEEFGNIINLEAEITAITLCGEKGVRVEYLHERTTHTRMADYCVSNIPLPVLRGTTLCNFSQPFTDVIKKVGFAPTCKVGWQANKRFWEDDSNEIYGGISWTDHNITQMWYPSDGYFTSQGILAGAYNFGENAEDLGKLEPKRRLEVARAGGVELHQEFEDEDMIPSSQGITIAWHKVPHQLGGWAAWDPEKEDHMMAYKQLLQPEGGGRFYVVGDQASPLPGWQEGALMSAHYVIGQIGGIIPLTVPDVVQVPNSVALTQGLS